MTLALVLDDATQNELKLYVLLEECIVSNHVCND